MTVYVFPGNQTVPEVKKMADELGMEITANSRGVLTLSTKLECNEKRERAVEYLRSRRKFILDQGTPAPDWSAA